MNKEIEELKLQIEEINNKILELESKEKENNWWIPKDGDIFYIVGENREISADRYHENSCFSKCYIDNLNYYKTEKQAKRKAFEQLLHRKLEKFAFENNESEVDWNNCNRDKYCLSYNNTDKTLDVDCYCSIKYYGQVYFTSREIAEKCIEEFKDDLIRYFTTNK